MCLIVVATWPTTHEIRNSRGFILKIIANRHSGNDDADLKFSPIIKAGVAEGLIYHGCDFSGSKYSGLNYIDDLVFGKPITRAHLSESEAPPFGIHIHQSMDHENAGTDVEWWNSKWGKKVHQAVDQCLEIHAKTRRLSILLKILNDIGKKLEGISQALSNK